MSASPPLPGSTDPRYRVDVSGFEHHIHADDALDALRHFNVSRTPHPPLLLRGDTLVRVSNDEAHVKLAAYTEPALKELLSEGAIFFRPKPSPDGTMGWARTTCPAYIPKALLHRTPDKLGGVPRINRVVEVPVFGPAADVFDKLPDVLGIPGYDPESRTYFQPPRGFKLPNLGLDEWVDEDGDEAQDYSVNEALALISELLCDFPFADDASRAHAIAMMLEPFVREVIGDEPTPMYGVLAHTPGTGKGLLTQCCLGIACGTLSPMTFTGGKGFEAAESRKRLTAKLIEAPPVIFYDNVTEPLDDPNLAAALTATRWSDRILGVSRMADVPIRNVWVFTANNPTISRELTRRIVPIFLEPGDIDPLARADWTHRLPQWAVENRGDLVAACLSLAANYFHGTGWTTDWTTGEEVRSRPASLDVLASFPKWSSVLGGILAAAGIRGFLGNLDKLHAQAAVDVSERADFLAQWFERQVQPHTLTELAGQGGILGAWVAPNGEMLPDVELPLELKGHGTRFEAKFGAWLRDHRDEVIGGYRVRKVEGRPARWTVEKVGA